MNFPLCGVHHLGEAFHAIRALSDGNTWIQADFNERWRFKEGFLAIFGGKFGWYVSSRLCVTLEKYWHTTSLAIFKALASSNLSVKPISSKTSLTTLGSTPIPFEKIIQCIQCNMGFACKLYLYNVFMLGWQNGIHSRFHRQEDPSNLWTCFKPSLPLATNRSQIPSSFNIF